MLGRESEAQLAANDLDIVLHPPPQTTTRVVRELGVENLDQANASLRQNLATSLIVAFALLSAVHSAHSDHSRLVEVRHGRDVLSFAVFDNQLQVGPVRIDRKASTAPSGNAGIATQEIESRLAGRFRPEDLITEIDDVMLVSLLPHG
jgi:hypothetical protein